MTPSLAAIITQEPAATRTGFTYSWTALGRKILWLVGWLACVLFCLAEEKKESAPELAFKLRDSSFVRGVPTVEKVPFQSALAGMDVPLAKLRNVEFKDDQKTAVLHFQNGDRLEGVINLKAIGLKTAYGKLEVELREIVSIQVSGIPTSTGSVPAEGLVGHWPLDGNANDVSGNNHHGKVIGATPTQGISGGAYRFDGDAGIDLGPLEFSSEQFTVSGWIRTDEPAWTEDWKTWISKLDGSGGPFSLGLGDGRLEGAGNGAHAMVWIERGSEVNLISRDIKQNLRDGRWHMFSFTYQRGSQNLYVDGKLSASGTFLGPLPSNQTSVRIGGHHFGSYHHPWVGDVDEVLIYNRALGGDKVMQLFRTQRPVNASDQP